MNDCKHCRNGWLDNRFGQDVECVNGVLIDIDVAYEGWQRDVDYPVAPCHPMWKRQSAGDDSFPNDCQERLAAWASPDPYETDEVKPADGAAGALPTDPTPANPDAGRP